MAEQKKPKHIAFIMDGNGRWAQRLGLLRLDGHRRGVDTVEAMMREAVELGIPNLTFYAFSSENWKRPPEEVSGLFKLLRDFFTSKLDTLVEEGVRVLFMGNREVQRADGGPVMSKDVLDILDNVEQRTAGGTRLTVCFAINYSGQEELTRAAQRWQFSGTKEVLTPEVLSQYMDVQMLPLDLIIRTSGEQRLSNFMLWQAAYAELLFYPKHWPDFKKEDLHACLEEYAERDRRFGALKQGTAS